VLAKLRTLCLALPDSFEKISHGEPSFFTKKRMFAMFANANTHHGNGRHRVWLAAPGRQERVMRTAPDRFFIPPYTGPSGWIGVYLDEHTRWEELADILPDAHRLAGAAHARLKPRAPFTRRDDRIVIARHAVFVAANVDRRRGAGEIAAHEDPIDAVVAERNRVCR
jgi:YjbR